ncbi:orotidine-5'-phosphate decarboxylase [Mangrovivirga sp. M17]|uniref:Orotidine 5'-phosphate decarboxylase n=1 Tax=Mangrovivirga halotolerans TaxID=2993936 RepID=A0ABT3RKX7_9BACT|nr:orotidine-5'-phosphate decarboxylase [Mangrovivirga halotolerans]MCX2742466.1 orotidine-5'-phosphate decarboxylase [Mangrovivirga halotolerans]
MDRKKLVEEIRKKKSFLCVGLDTDIRKIPEHLLETDDPIFEFNKQIIDATKDYCVAYKPNIAFYEAHGPKGWESLKKTVDYIPSNHFTIADAKRGDIGNTSGLYARAFFEEMDFDSITVAPYMGKDSVTPFLEFDGRWVILLGLTSNPGADDFQQLNLSTGEKVYQKVIERSSTWGNKDNMMYVVGATRAEALTDIRKIIPDNFLLIPGVGAQGGSLKDVIKYGMNDDVGLLVNSTRGIIYADSSESFAEAAKAEAQKIQNEMAAFL